MVSTIRQPEYFDLVFQHGGDPNLESQSVFEKGNTPLLTAIGTQEYREAPRRYKGQKARIKRLIELGADLNHVNGEGVTPAQLAAGWKRFDIVLMLLDAGAKTHVVVMDKKSPCSNLQIAHFIVEHEKKLASFTPQEQKEYAEVVKRLEAAGESLDQARDELERGWYPTPTGEWVLLPASLPRAIAP